MRFARSETHPPLSLKEIMTDMLISSFFVVLAFASFHILKNDRRHLLKQLEKKMQKVLVNVFQCDSTQATKKRNKSTRLKRVSHS